MTVPAKVPRTVAPLAKFAQDNGWIVREPTVTLGDWGGTPDVQSVVLRMIHQDSPLACFAIWLDGRWRSASTMDLRYFKTATEFKKFLASPGEAP